MLSLKGMKTHVCLFLLFTVAIIADVFSFFPHEKKARCLPDDFAFSSMNHVRRQIDFFVLFCLVLIRDILYIEDNVL